MIEAFLQELDGAAQATRRVLERVPEDKLDWKPHDKSMSLGQLSMHLATLPGAIAELSTQETFNVNTEVPRPSATSLAEVLEALEHSLAKAKTLFSNMDDAALATPWKMVSEGHEVAVMPRSAFLRSILFNHWYHHRGQMTVYLRLVGASVPGIYGASADEAPVFV